MKLYPLEFDDQMQRVLRHNRLLTPSGLYIDDYHEHLGQLFGDGLATGISILKNPVAARELAANILSERYRRRGVTESLDHALDTADVDVIRGLVHEGVNHFHFMRDLHHHRWMKCGQRIYTLSQELVTAFGRVEMNYPVSALNFPFHEFFLQFEHDWMLDDGGDGMPFAGVYVSSPCPMRDVPRSIQVSIGGPPVEIRFTDTTDDGVLFEVLLCWWADDPSEGAGYADRLGFRGDVEVEASIADALKVNGTGVSDKLRDTRLRLYRIVLNTIMYMSSVDPDVVVREVVSRPPASKKGKKRRRVVKSKFRRTKVVYLGSRLKPSVSRASPVGHVRRGHYRWQPCGKKNLQRKFIFIPSTWVKGKKSDTVHVTDVDREES